MKGRAKSIVLTSSLSPGSAAYSTALKTKKSIPALSRGSGGGGCIVSNDWCITSV